MKWVDVMKAVLISVSVIAMGCSGGGGGGATGDETGGDGVSECLAIHTCDKACDPTDDACQDACVEGASDEALELYGELQLCMVGCLLDCMSALTEFTEGVIAGCESSCETDGCGTEYMACATAIEPSEESGEATGGTETGDDPVDAETGDDPLDAETGDDPVDAETGDDPVDAETGDDPVDAETGVDGWDGDGGAPMDCIEDADCESGKDSCEGAWAYTAPKGQCNVETGNCFWNEPVPPVDCSAEGLGCENGECVEVEPECTDDNDCGTDAYCDGNVAVPGNAGSCNNGSCLLAPGQPPEDCSAAGKECVAGECVEAEETGGETGSEGCGGLTFEGCCTPEGVVEWCENGQAQAANCKEQPDPSKQECGWNGGIYDCTGTSTADPSGVNPLWCGEAPPSGLDCNDIQTCISDCDADAPEAVFDACVAACEDSAAPSALNAHTNLIQCIQTACQSMAPAAQPACVQAAAQSGGACQPQAFACFGPDGSDPPFTCAELVTCINSCTDDPSEQINCVNTCQGAADLEAGQIFTSLIQCIQTNCVTATGQLDPVCAYEAQIAGGVCYGLLTACGDDTL